jgi:RNA polymerase sigma-70 factor (ECF subfamily)
LFQAPTQENALAMRKLDEAVQKLPPLRREALVLVVAHGLSYEQVAVICGCAVGTVKSRVARAREELHAALSGEFAAEDRKADPTAQAARLGRPRAQADGSYRGEQ